MVLFEEFLAGLQASRRRRVAAVVGVSAAVTVLLTVFSRQLSTIVLVSGILCWSLYRLALRYGLPPVWPVAAMLVPLTIGLFDMVYPFMPVFGDAAQYDSLGRLVVSSLQSGFLPQPDAFSSIQVRTYGYFLGFVYSIFGAHSTIAIAFNSWFWGLAVVFWLQIADQISDRSIGHYAGALYLVYPAAIMYVSVTLREAMALCALTISLWFWLRWLRDGSFRCAVGGVAALFPLVLLRAEVLPPVFVGIAAGWLLKNQERFAARQVGQLLVGGTIVAVVLGAIDRRVQTHLNPFRVTLLERVRSNSAARAEGYLRGLEYTSLIDIFLYLPIRLFYLLFAPFPWLLSSYDQFMATADALFVLVVTACTIYYVFSAREVVTPEFGFLFGYALSLLAGYSLVVSQSGVASRRRLYAVPVLILFGAYGLMILHDRVHSTIDGDRSRYNKL